MPVPDLPAAIHDHVSEEDSAQNVARDIIRLPADPAIGRTPVQPVGPIFPWPILRHPRHGCYLIRYTPAASGWWLQHYDGTMRVQRDGSTTVASGDLYTHPISWFPFGSTTAEPTPAGGIPIFRRSRYAYYVRVTDVVPGSILSTSLTLEFELHRFNISSDTFTNVGLHRAEMAWETAPTGYPDPNNYLTGSVTKGGQPAGNLTMGWVSHHLRKATIEIDTVSASEQPLDNGSGIDWHDAFQDVGWQITVDASSTTVSEPSGQSWSDAECHQAMLTRRDSSDLDSEWRYHILCVRLLDSTSRGIMYDAYGGDSNNVPREGAACATHWTIPNTATWGTVAGQRFGTADAPYFRTAVHEIGHAMGLYHNTVDTGFMNTTGTIAASPGTFPSNIGWDFAADDQKRLRHLPDPWVRPGGNFSFGGPYTSVPISDDDDVFDPDELTLAVSPLIPAVPIGAPVRIDVELSNTGDHPLPVPHSLSLRHGFVRGRVIDPSGRERTFWPLIHCLEEHELVDLAPGDSLVDSATLLRGPDGALFPTPGHYEVVVEVVWDVDAMAVGVTGTTGVMVSGTENAGHADAAARVLGEPDALLSLVIGGDHLEKGQEAIDACLNDDVLRPHYAIVEAKRVGRRFGGRGARVEDAAELIADAVLSEAEAAKAEEILGRGTKATREKAAVKKAARRIKAAKS